MIRQQLLCFQVLDKEKKGYLESEELIKYLTQEGNKKIYLDYPCFVASQTAHTLNLFLDCNDCAVPVYTPGEPLTQEEMDEMLAALANKENHCIYYKDLLSQLTIDCD